MSSTTLSGTRPLMSPSMKAALGCAICLALGLIPFFMGTFPVFLGPVSTEFHWGLSIFPQAPMIVGLSAAITGPFIGRLLDRKGVRVILPLGIALWCLGLFSLSLMNGSLVSLYAVAIIIGIGGTIAGPIAFAKVINGWFDRNRGLALGVLMSGVPAIATAIAVQVSQHLIDHYEWRMAYQALAIAALAVTVPACLLFIREAPSRNVAGAPEIALGGLTSRQAFRSRDFYLTVGPSSLAICAIMGVTNHFVGWMAEGGVSKDSATLAISLFSLAGPLGPLVGGLLVDRIATSKIVAGFFVLAPIGMGLLYLGGHYGMFAGMVLLGLTFSSINGLAPYLVSRYFGLMALSEILAVTFASLTIGMGLGPVLMGLGHDLSGSYSYPMAIATGATWVAFMAALLLKPYRFGAPPRP